MKRFVLLLFPVLVFGCGSAENETKELYDAYLDQYSSLQSSLIQQVYYDKIIYEYGSNEHKKHIEKVITYIINNDALLTPESLLEKYIIDSISQSYSEILKEIPQYMPNGNFKKYKEDFPKFSFSESCIEQQVKIKQSNLSLLKAYVLGKYRLNCGEQPFLPTPQLIHFKESNDSIYYSFIYGHPDGILRTQKSIKDTLFTTNSSISQSTLSTKNGQLLLSIPHAQKQMEYNLKALLVIYDWRTNSDWQYPMEINIKIP